MLKPLGKRPSRAITKKTRVWPYIITMMTLGSAITAAAATSTAETGWWSWRSTKARGQIAMRRHIATFGAVLSEGVFSCLLVSQMTPGCRAALTGGGFAGTERVMLPTCPYLPTPRPGLDWKMLNAFPANDRGAEFYDACLEYGHSLWKRKYAARAMLCLDRAMGADLKGDE